MLLADTSVWIDHFRRGNRRFEQYLSEGMVLIHPCVSGELACGNLKNRATILAELHALPLAMTADDTEVLHLIQSRKLWGRGIGWVDAQLVAAALISQCLFWTLDSRLGQVADDLGLVKAGAGLDQERNES